MRPFAHRALDLVGLRHESCRGLVLVMCGTNCALSVIMPNDSLQTVLVVDDEALVRRALSRELSAAYIVKTAGSVEEALEILADDGRICAVITDYDMGSHTGDELLAAVRRVAPHCACILVSGRPRATDPAICDAFVAKPWALGRVVSAVQDVWVRL